MTLMGQHLARWATWVNSSYAHVMLNTYARPVQTPGCARKTQPCMARIKSGLPEKGQSQMLKSYYSLNR